LQEGVRVAFAGLPNAGKSSFFNALLGENRSIVSEIPGTTRDIIREKLTLRGKNSTVTLRLEDTAGLREIQKNSNEKNSHDSIEEMGIQLSIQSIQQSDLLLFFVDPATPFPAIEAQFPKNNIKDRTIGILTKEDRTPPHLLSQALENLSKLGIQNGIITSAVTGIGIPEAIEAIIHFCEKSTCRNPGELLLTRLDHFQAVESALSHLQRAQTASEIDLFASDIRQALYALAPLIGETLPDDILGRIFSDFCIGK
jgi:tRNA modification GTPase